MAEQSFKSHARWEPQFHFFLAPLAILNLGFAIYATVHRWPAHRHLYPWWIVMSVALIVAVGLIRSYPLKVQDRVIRLEERIRLAQLLPPAEAVASHALETPQLIALRFASDAELPGLVRRTLAERLDPKQIKAAITTWRPDNHRV